MVYFDFLGYIFIAYTEATGQILNVIVVAASVIISYFALQTKGINRRYVRKEIVYGFLATVFGYIISKGVCWLIATELDLNGKSMSWFNHTSLVVALYICPSLAVHCLFYAQLTRTRDSPLSLGLKAQARLCGVNLIWAFLTLGLTVAGFRSAYVFMVPVLVTLFTNTLIIVTKAQNTSKY